MTESSHFHANLTDDHDLAGNEYAERSGSNLPASNRGASSPAAPLDSMDSPFNSGPRQTLPDHAAEFDDHGDDETADEHQVQPPSDAGGLVSAELAAIREVSTRLDAALELVTAELGAFHDRAAAQEALIGKMHGRIELLQQGEAKKWLKPVSTQLVTLYSDIEDTTSALGPDATVEQFTGLLSNFSLAVEQILDNLGLSPLETAPGETFEPRLHQAVKKIDTTDPASDRKIVAVLRQGFIEPGEAKPMVPSRVSVYRFTGESVSGDAAPPGSSTPSTDQAGAQ
ncbi:nucleotide exchange factor GrpE [Mycobacterium sp. NPDC050041]|uniref:nucleotide exchange factor GrpE n=1 Tax=Mycobacterium sp. NPDC050041 TaxID=3364293 RepID=UPI003C2CCD3C